MRSMSRRESRATMKRSVGMRSKPSKSLVSRILMANQIDLFENVTAVHPGEMISEYLEFNDWSQRDLHRRAGLTPKLISEICSGKAPVSPPTALALERAFQRPA